MQTIRTARLKMVPVSSRNAQLLWHTMQQPDLRTYQELPNLRLEAFTQLVAQRPSGLRRGVVGRFEWLLYVTSRRPPVGWVSLRIAESDNDTGEIGYSVLREYRGRGLATEAVRLLLTEAFERAQLASVQAFCVPDNVASRKLLARLRFRPDGVLPRGAIVSGTPVDVLVHRLDAQRWRQSGKTIETPASV